MSSSSAISNPSMGHLRLLPGTLLCLGLAAAAMAAGELSWLQAHGISALTLAIVLGMLLGHTAYPQMGAAAGPGVAVAKQQLLRAGIVLYGFRLTVQDVGHVGWAGVLIDSLVLGSTFLVACVLGTRLFGLDRRTSMLIGAGSAICGAAAVMAADPVVKARSEQVTVAVATVVVFGTISIFLYPLLFQLNTAWGLIPGGAEGFGLYTGSTVHEVAQVVAAARSMGTEAADAAVIAKMVRVMMLAPFLLMLGLWIDRTTTAASVKPGTEAPRKGRITIPWFAFGFVAVVLFNSLHLLPEGLVTALVQLDTVLLAMAMAALGITTHLGAVRKAGARPLLLALSLFAWLIVGGGAINALVGRLLS